MSYRVHTDGKGNITYRAPMRNTSERFNYANNAPQQFERNSYESQGGYEDPFEKYGRAFSSLGAISDLPPPPVDVQPPPQAQNAAENADLARYRNFLLDQFIDPDTIGGAIMDRNSGRMIVPTIKQQEMAMKLKDRDNREEGDMMQWIRNAQSRGDNATATAISNRVRAGNMERGPSFEERYNYYLQKIMGRGSNRSNGFFS